MTKIVLVRHGEPDYTYVTQRGFKGHGIDLGPLTKLGIEQANIAADDQRLAGAQLIIASPYTRAMQTAAIISKKRQLDISVEVDLHEWIPDLNFSLKSDDEVREFAKDCSLCRGEYPDGDQRRWEPLSVVAKRSIACLQKYLTYEKVIVVCHGIVMRQFAFQRSIPYCGILEVDFDETFTWDGWIQE